jgi:hypothetical protein
MANAGHNSGDLTEAEERSLFFHHLRKRMSHNSQLAVINADKKADAKIAQADGLVIGDLDYAIKALEAEDKGTITDRYLSHGKVLTWLGLAEGYQPDLFADRAAGLDAIEKRGERAGLAALTRESEYAPGSDEDQCWLRGYDNGQAIVRDNLQSAMEKRNAAKAGADELIKGAADEDPFEQDEAA